MPDGSSSPLRRHAALSPSGSSPVPPRHRRRQDRAGRPGDTAPPPAPVVRPAAGRFLPQQFERGRLFVAFYFGRSGFPDLLPLAHSDRS